jgi:hypothetical protein
MSEQPGFQGNLSELAEQILDRIASDGEFRQQLLDNPIETLKQAGYESSDEVSGYSIPPGAATTRMGGAPGYGSTLAGKIGGVGPGVTLTTVLTCGPPRPHAGGQSPAEPYTGQAADVVPTKSLGPAAH